MSEIVIENIDIYNETKETVTENMVTVFCDLKNEILGTEFELCVSILLPTNSKKINFKMRKEKYVPNTLSFLYSSVSGEIILTPEIIRSECADFDHTFPEHFLFLYIHSLLHLKSHEHGSEMEALEGKYFTKYRKSI